MARKPQGPFAALAALKPAARISAPRAARSQPPDPAPDADLPLFRAAVQDVRPLRAAPRAELDIPKPAPQPRPRIIEVEPPAPPKRPRPQDDASLFQAEMADVQRLKHSNRVEFDAHHHRPHTAAGIGGSAPELLALAQLDLNDPAQLFRLAVRGTQSLADHGRAELEPPRPAPTPRKREADERQVLSDTLHSPISFEDRLDMGDEAAFLRPGLPRRVLTDLRRGRWILQGEIDLHGLNREQAREALGHFLALSLREGRRCVRVIHGKGLGSPGRESILKQLSRAWLAQREEILAFCQPRPHDGGEGALLVLLAAGRAR